ncbi:hypothetical protein [Flavobacterium phage FL-1]|nr:hypothetical protein [Flavobacterium phage FL-1]
MEEMSGLKFKDDSVRFQLDPFEAEYFKEMQNLVSTGYYSQEQFDSFLEFVKGKSPEGVTWELK